VKYEIKETGHVPGNSTSYSELIVDGLSAARAIEAILTRNVLRSIRPGDTVVFTYPHEQVTLTYDQFIAIMRETFRFTGEEWHL
jgi:ASC-1-like (ASCH) protein